MFSNADVATRFFHAITAHPRLAVLVSIVVIAITGSGLSQLVKNTSVKAFIPPDHPALLADEHAAEVFGLSDTVAVALVSRDGSSIFTPEALAMVSALSDAIAELPNVRRDRVTSLATEVSIGGGNGAIDVVPYIDGPSPSAADAADSRARLQSMPPHVGTIVAEDETGTVILAELVDSDLAGRTYRSILELVAAFENDRFELHVAGPGAVSGYLGEYIDQDARKLQPLVFLLVLGFIYLAFRRLRALPGPLLVVVGAAAGSLGIMAWSGVPYYAITNALPVIVIAISVADAIHILSAYFRFRAQLPNESVRGLVVRSMVTMTRPITLTTLTTIAGFTGIAVASIMPPITAFAWFAALGVALAWVFSIFALPSMLILLRPGPSPAFENWREDVPSGLGRILAQIGAFAAARYVSVLCVFAVVSAVAAYGAMQLRVDRSQVENFAPGEAIRLADETINDRFAGTAFLDVVIETAEPGGLLDNANMHRVLELQSYFESLPFVQMTIGITDYLDRLHRAISDEPVADEPARTLPTEEDSIAQYLLVYEMSGDPTDFEEEIDYDYQTALIRGILDTHYFSDSRPTVEALQRYIQSEFNDATITATLTGDVSIGYHWMSHLERSHFLSVALSLGLVLATSVLVFRSLTAGVIAVIPVTFAVLVLYAVMGYLGIYLEPATSMFAAIALGVGVDFGIHLVERMREAYATHADDTAAAVNRALPATARACFFNSAALGLGFAVLMVSDLPTLQRFGGLVAVAAVSSYAAALVIVPALFAAEAALWRRFAAPARSTVVRIISAALLAGTFAVAADRAEAGQYSADEIAARVAARPEGRATSRSIDIILTNRKGRTRQRQALVLKESRETGRFTRITYTAPKRIRDTSFLSHDLQGTDVDHRWLYMPAMRKVRRIPASDRGDYFLGTDFTYEDIQSELKFDLEDYVFRYDGEPGTNNESLLAVSGEPVNGQVANELGYGAFKATIDETNWMPAEVVFYDTDGALLKTIHVDVVEQIDGIWTATSIRAINHQTGHQTEFRFRDVRYTEDLPDEYFETPALSRGLGSFSRGVSR